MRERKIVKVIRGKEVLEGAGVRLKRLVGMGDPYEFDPFLLFDDFSSDEPSDYLKGFPWHPHRGIETITYVLKGSVEHGDSLGNSGTISEGDVQWMTAGSGIIHQEMPFGDSDGSMHGFQLWANLPASHKMMAPRYRDIKSEDIPEIVHENGIKIRLICGSYSDKSGPAKDIVIEPEYLDIFVPEKSTFKHSVETGHKAFAYVISGRCIFCTGEDFDGDNGTTVNKGNIALFDDGDYITVAAPDSSARFLLVSGKPLGEPIAWYGPIVMNTEEELETAFREYREGTFIKKF